MRITEDLSIQVAQYLGRYGKHTEIDIIMFKTKWEAFDFIQEDRVRTFQKEGKYYNYRIVDFLRRFKPIFFEQ